ncbi:MAG TPA: helix-turn-helix domain-containing protein [Candidatus Kapabacteria bacterium]|nr:helix-turn-helix domain-containing protein [Candidatus Kapabacteria bacterium]
MEWTPETIRLLRKHTGDTQEQFAHRLGLKRRFTIIDWETGRRHPSGMARRLLDVLANDHGFTERVAARLRDRLKREEGE